MHEQQSMLNGIDILTSGDTESGVMAVIAHPDDNAFTNAGTLLKMNELGLSTCVLLMTDGDYEGNRAGRKRVNEQHEENDILGVSELKRACLPDGGFKPAMVPYAAKWIAGQIVRAQEEGRKCGTILTFGEEGFSGHPDHSATNRAVRMAVNNLKRSGLFTGNVWEICMSERERSMWPRDYFVPVPPANTSGCIRIDLRGDVLRDKIDALKVHRSQRNNGGDRQVDIVYANPEEYWRLWQPFSANTISHGRVYGQNGRV